MNPILRGVLFVMLMRAAEQFVDYIGARLRSGGGFVYELSVLAPRSAPVGADLYPSHVSLSSPAHPEEVIEVCGLLFEIDMIIRAEGRCDRLLLAPISIDMVSLGAPRISRFTRAWARFSGYVEALIGGVE